MLLNKQNVHLTQPTPALTPVYLTSRQGVDTEDGSLASDHDYHIVICSVTRGLVQRPGRPWTPCVMLPWIGLRIVTVDGRWILVGRVWITRDRPPYSDCRQALDSGG